VPWARIPCAPPAAAGYPSPQLLFPPRAPTAAALRRANPGWLDPRLMTLDWKITRIAGKPIKILACKTILARPRPHHELHR
jgi:hypothetical protein